MPGSGASWLVGMLGLLVARLGLHVVLPELLGCSVGAGFDTSCVLVGPHSGALLVLYCLKASDPALLLMCCW